jgi:hypothetical protein
MQLDASKDLHTLHEIARRSGVAVHAVKRAADRLSLSPSLALNGVPYYDRNAADAVKALLQDRPDLLAAWQLEMGATIMREWGPR